MAGFAQARRMMVDGQIRTSDVTDLRLLDAMFEMPRERFVPPDKAGLAYLDDNISVSQPAAGQPSRSLLKPMVLAKLLQAAEVGAADDVLDVGSATGYAAALLSRLARHVVALEEEESLGAHASKALAELGANNVSVVIGPLAAGWPTRAPYDMILLEGRTEIRPQVLFQQLKDGGRLLCVQGKGPVAKAMLYRADGGDVSGRPIFDALAPVLPGFAERPTFVF